jgi:hypothetical protein
MQSTNERRNAMNMPDDDRYYWAEDIARLADIKVRTVHRYATLTQSMIERGELDPVNTGGELPPPVDRVKRTMHTRGGQPRTVISSRWEKARINDWLPQRRGPGGRLVDPDAYQEYVRTHGGVGGEPGD